MQTPSQSEPQAELTPRARDSQLLGSLVGFLIAYFLSPWLSHQLADSLWPVSLILIGIGGAVGFYLGALWYRESSPKSAATTAIGYLLMSTVGGAVLFSSKQIKPHGFLPLSQYTQLVLCIGLWFDAFLELERELPVMALKSTISKHRKIPLTLIQDRCDLGRWWGT